MTTVSSGPAPAPQRGLLAVGNINTFRSFRGDGDGVPAFDISLRALSFLREAVISKQAVREFGEGFEDHLREHANGYRHVFPSGDAGPQLCEFIYHYCLATQKVRVGVGKKTFHALSAGRSR